MFRQHDNIFCAVLHASTKAFALMYTNKYVYKKIVTSFQLLIVVWYLSLNLGRWRANKVMTACILKREMLPVLDIESCLQINIVTRNAIARNSHTESVVSDEIVRRKWQIYSVYTMRRRPVLYLDHSVVLIEWLQRHIYMYIDRRPCYLAMIGCCGRCFSVI